MKNKKLLLHIIILINLMAIPFYSQTTIPDPNLFSLVEKSDLIVRGIVINQNSYYKENGRIYSEFKFIINNIYKGNIKIGQEIGITMLGGTVNGITMFSPEYPKFKVKEESILFLNQNPRVTNNYIVNCLKDGKYNIFTDKNGDLMIIRDRFADIEIKIQSNSTYKSLSNKNAIPLSLFLDHLPKKLY